MTLLGLDGDERFTTFAGRAEHRDEIEAVMAAWCARAHVDGGARRVRRPPRRRPGR